MKNEDKTPMEKAQLFAQNLASSLRIHQMLTEFERLDPEEQGTLENKLVLELLIKAVELSYKAENIEA